MFEVCVYVLFGGNFLSLDSGFVLALLSGRGEGGAKGAGAKKDIQKYGFLVSQVMEFWEPYW